MPADALEVQAYRELEARVRKNDLDALLARWEFGHQLLKDKSARERGEWMPMRRRISSALEISGAEINNRMQLADEYQQDALPELLAKHLSWHGICKAGLGRRGSDWRREWQDMPEFDQPDRPPWKSLTVHFADLGDLELFAKAINQTVTPSTRSLWYPPAEIERAANKRYVNAA